MARVKASEVALDVKFYAEKDKLLDSRVIRLERETTVTSLTKALHDTIVAVIRATGHIPFAKKRGGKHDFLYDIGFRFTDSGFRNYTCLIDSYPDLNIDTLADLFREPDKKDKTVDVVVDIEAEKRDTNSKKVPAADWAKNVRHGVILETYDYFRLGISTATEEESKISETAANALRARVDAAQHADTISTYDALLAWRYNGTSPGWPGSGWLIPVPVHDFGDVCFGNSYDSDYIVEESHEGHIYLDPFERFNGKARLSNWRRRCAVKWPEGGIFLAVQFVSRMPGMLQMVFPEKLTVAIRKENQDEAEIVRSAAIEAMRNCPKPTIVQPKAERKPCIRLFDKKYRGQWIVQLWVLQQDPAPRKLRLWAPGAVDEDGRVTNFGQLECLSTVKGEKGDSRVFMLAVVGPKDTGAWMVTGSPYEKHKAGDVEAGAGPGDAEEREEKTGRKKRRRTQKRDKEKRERNEEDGEEDQEEQERDGQEWERYDDERKRLDEDAGDDNAGRHGAENDEAGGQHDPKEEDEEDHAKQRPSNAKADSEAGTYRKPVRPPGQASRGQEQSYGFTSINQGLREGRRGGGKPYSEVQKEYNAQQRQRDKLEQQMYHHHVRKERVDFRLCDAGIYPYPRTVSPGVDGRVVPYAMRPSSDRRRLSNDWDRCIRYLTDKFEIPFDGITEVHWHRQEESCSSIRPFAGKVILYTSGTICLHFITKWTEMLVLHPCGFHIGKNGSPFAEAERRLVRIPLYKGVRYSREGVARAFLAVEGVPEGDVAEVLYHPHGEECATMIPFGGKLEGQGWDRPVHMHLRLKTGEAFEWGVFREKVRRTAMAIRELGGKAVGKEGGAMGGQDPLRIGDRMDVIWRASLDARRLL
ncbi:hypothetical protein B0A55_07702 [Friedmanniomyces simplex]|uniref:Uncharacterized protein n=1 Tax=Friedmanniomyces simplex TaxID=329884 RepID=A0A4U0XAL3_9PEZI|nr:hypothetical protein B0A55_07702 [Friedmanniomyces simplex]